MHAPFFLRQRFFEIIFPLFTWSAITMPLWLSPFHPAVVAYLIIVFDVYFLYKTFRTIIMAGISYRNIVDSQRINWLTRAKNCNGFRRLTHFMLIANYKEPYTKVKATLNALTRQNYSLKKIHIVLAMEDSEGEEARKRFARLQKKFEGVFGGFYATYHVLQPGEAKGKASNGAYAARFISRRTRVLRLKPTETLITVCDADSILDKEYCAYLTTRYLLEEQNKYHFYWAPVLLYNNYWKLNFFIRIQTTLSSIVRLAFLSEKHNLIQISTYSASLWLFEQINYWDTHIVPEDWHLFLQAFFKFGNKVVTEPIYLVTTRDGVRGRTFWESFRNRYEQEKRWAWGVSDVPYALEKLFQTPHIPLFDRLFRVLSIIETHLLWPTSFFLLTLGANIPILINPYFKRSVLGFLLPQIAGAILTMATALVVAVGYLDFQAKHRLLKQPEKAKLPLLVLQWVFFPVLTPIISALLSSLPALESHTRLMLGKKLSYKVTKKI